MNRSGGLRILAALLLCSFPMGALAKEKPGTCASCPAQDVVPTQMIEILSLSCFQKKPKSGADVYVNNRCQELETELDGLSLKCHLPELKSANIEWDSFKAGFKNPCGPIPAKYLDRGSPFFEQVMKLIAPKIVMSPDDDNPPDSLENIVMDIKADSHLTKPLKAGSNSKVRLPFSTDAAMSASVPERLTYSTNEKLGDCSVPLNKKGRCCGVLKRAPMSFDVQEKKDEASGEKMVSVSFATTHRYGSVMDISKVGNFLLGDRTPGTHLFDSEVSQFDYVKGADGFATLRNLKFTRHGSAAEPFDVCKDGKFLMGGHREMSHPVFFQARGGHALYPGAEVKGGKRTEMRGSGLEKVIEGNTGATEDAERGNLLNPYSASGAILGMITEGHTVRDIQNEYYDTVGGVKGACVTTLDPGNLSGIGSLWNDPVLGANKDGYFGLKTDKADFCLGYGEGKHNFRSLRHLTGWLDQDDDALKKFGCGYKPGE